MDRQAVKDAIQETIDDDVEILHRRIDEVQKNMRRLQRIVRILVRRNGRLTEDEEIEVEA